MSLMRDILDLAIDIEFDEYYTDDYGVNFYIDATPILCEVANNMRHRIGFAPLNCCDEDRPWGGAVDGYYNFYLMVKELDIDDPGHSKIEMVFVVVSDFVRDNDKMYDVDLDSDDVAMLCNVIIDQYEDKTGKNFFELLDEIMKGEAE